MPNSGTIWKPASKAEDFPIPLVSVPRMRHRTEQRPARPSREHDLGFARIDHDRETRCGIPEVVFAPGKTAAQVAAILRATVADGHNAWASRVSPEQAKAVLALIPEATYHAASRSLTWDVEPLRRPQGLVAVLCAGTSDLPIAEEAAFAAERLGARVIREFDVGVAGLHRLLSRLDSIRRARVVVAVAGMEGALPSVVGGLVACPVIAVPTSVGYGVGAGGLAALAGMLTGCAAGVTVVNIDNGFGAGVAAAKINRLGSAKGRKP